MPTQSLLLSLPPQLPCSGLPQTDFRNKIIWLKYTFYRVQTVKSGVNKTNTHDTLEHRCCAMSLPFFSLDVRCTEALASFFVTLFVRSWCSRLFQKHLKNAPFVFSFAYRNSVLEQCVRIEKSIFTNFQAKLKNTPHNLDENRWIFEIFFGMTENRHFGCGSKKVGCVKLLRVKKINSISVILGF